MIIIRSIVLPNVAGFIFAHLAYLTVIRLAARQALAAGSSQLDFAFPGPVGLIAREISTSDAPLGQDETLVVPYTPG